MYRCAVVLLVCASLVPAESAAQDAGSWGFGVGLQQTSIVFDDDLFLANAIAPTIYVPFVLNDRLMIEPGIGLWRMSREGGDFDPDVTSTALRASVGLLISIAEPERGRFYAGPRIGLLRLASKYEFEGDDGEMTRMDLFAAAVAGGEAFLTPSFSLGGEASLNYYTMGETEYDPDPGFEVNDDASLLSIGGEFLIRWYMP